MTVAAIDVEPTINEQVPLRVVFMADFNYWSVDDAIAGVPVLLLIFFFSLYTSVLDNIVGWILFFVLAIVIFLITNISIRSFFAHAGGATPGMRLLGVKIVSTSTGTNPTVSQAIKREILKYFSYFPHFPFSALMPNNQDLSWHDAKAGTAVVWGGNQTSKQATTVLSSDNFNIFIMFIVFVSIIAFCIYQFLLSGSIFWRLLQFSYLL